MTPQELFVRQIEEQAHARQELETINREEQEANDRFVGKCLLLVGLVIVGLLAYALAWWVCGAVLWPFAVPSGGGR